GEQGQAMTGTVTVLGAYSFAGVVRIGLRASTSAPVNGCRGATYDTTPERTAPTSVATAGDGTYAFRTPIAPRNRCYAITGTLTLTANPMVRADSPTSDSSIFLAGAQSRPTTFNDSLRGTGNGTLRTTIAFGIASGILLVLSAWVMVQAYVSARAYDELGGGWTWRPYRAADALIGSGGSLPRRPRPKPRPLP
ncbi:MAG: hypothetical protein M3Y06_06790, partial [Actinomycetota bacterium]|nr:hypothetical protein [Actinomycetota bacterium]